MKKLFEKLLEYKLFRELFLIFKYGLVGIVNTAVTTVIFLVLNKLGFSYLLYTIIGYACGILLSFFLNLYFTFRKSQEEGFAKKMITFFTISLTLLALVQLIQYLLIDKLELKEWLGVGLGMVFYTVTGFLLNRNLVFKYKDQENKTREINNEHEPENN